MNTTALVTAITGAAYGAMIAYRLAKGQRWTATGLAAIGTVVLANLVTMGNRSQPEHLIIYIASIALATLYLAACAAAQKHRERDLGRFLR